MGRQAFAARLLIDGTAGDPIKNPVVVIQDDRIVEISTSDEVDAGKLMLASWMELRLLIWVRRQSCPG